MTAETWAGRCCGCGHDVARTGCHCDPTPLIDVAALSTAVGKSGGMPSVASSLVQSVTA